MPAPGVDQATLIGPTLDTLHAVAAALDAPLTALVVGTPALVLGAAVEVELLRVFDDGPVTYELCRLRVPAGAEQRSPAHHAGVTEHVTVFAGVLEAGTSDHPRRGGAGEHLEWAADVPHRYAAVGDLDVLASLLIRSPRPGSG